MMRSCYLYQLKSPVKIDEGKADGLRGKDFRTLELAVATQKDKIYLHNLKKQITEEALGSPQQISDRRIEISFDCTIRLRPPALAGPSARTIRARIGFPIWLPRLGSFVAIFGASRGLARTISQLLGLSLLDNISSITPYQLGRDEFSNVETWLTRSDHKAPGSVLRATFEGPVWKGTLYDEITIRRNALGETELFDTLKKECKNWRALTFITPLFKAVGRQLTCRIESSGKLIAYTPTITPTEFDYLLEELEKLFMPRKEGIVVQFPR